jgi:hypothetical protein
MLDNANTVPGPLQSRHLTLVLLRHRNGMGFACSRGMIALRETAIRSLPGALAGFLATAPMSVWMLLGHRLLSWRSQEALPPEVITHEVLRAADWDDLSGNQEAALVAVSHFAYGTAMGAVYAQLPRPQSPACAVATGAAYGLAVWTGSYCGWLPAVGLYRPPTQDTVERTALMIGAHLVWGGTTGLLVHWLSRRESRAAGDENAVRLNDERSTARRDRSVREHRTVSNRAAIALQQPPESPTRAH